MKHRLEHMGRFDFICNIVISAAAILNLFPLYWMISSSLKVSQDVSKMPPDWIPFPPAVQNYKNLFQTGHALTWTCNSFLIAIGTTAAILLVSAMASYSFAKLRFWGRNTIFLAFILTLMIPKEIYIVPLIKVMQYLNLKGTYIGIILPNVALPFGVFLLRQFFATVPDSLRESAWLDGGSEWNVFTKIMLPICKPGLSALAILMFVQTWNDYLWQMVMITKDSMKTLQLGVALMQQENNPDYGLKMASACVAAVPMILVFFVFQRYFTSGITMGAIKE